MSKDKKYDIMLSGSRQKSAEYSQPNLLEQTSLALKFKRCRAVVAF